MSEELKTKVCPECVGTGAVLDSEVLGDEMRQARMAVAMTMTEMAQRIGVSQGFLSQMENGKRPWRTKHYIAYEQVLKEEEKHHVQR